MIIKGILILAILLAVGWFLSNRTSHQARAWQKIGIILLTAIGVVVVIFPNTSNTIAHKVGVGRGADLLLYLLTLSFIFTVLNSYLKAKEEQKRLVTLARKVALIEAELKYKKR